MSASSHYGAENYGFFKIWGHFRINGDMKICLDIIKCIYLVCCNFQLSFYPIDLFNEPFLEND